MKKLLLLALIVFGIVWTYFWYVRGVNILLKDAEETYLPAYTSYAVRIRPQGDEDMKYIWTEAVDLPTPRTDVAAANVGDIIYVVGGIDSFAKTVDTVEAFNTARNSWSTVAPLPQPLYHVALVSMDGKLYAVGGLEGFGQTPVDTMYIFDPEVGSWSTGKALPSAVGGAAALVRDGKIHVIGGRLGTGIGDSYFIYDPDADGWSYGEGLLGPRAFHGAASLDDRILIFGGRSGSLAQNLRTVSELQNRASNWEKVGIMNTKRSSFGTVVYAGKVYVFGGETAAASLDSVEVYDMANGEWEEITTMPTGRHGVGAVAVGGKIFVIGGGHRAGISVSEANEVFIPLGYLEDSQPEEENTEDQ